MISRVRISWWNEEKTVHTRMYIIIPKTFSLALPRHDIMCFRFFFLKCDFSKIYYVLYAGKCFKYSFHFVFSIKITQVSQVMAFVYLYFIYHFRSHTERGGGFTMKCTLFFFRLTLFGAIKVSNFSHIPLNQLN